MRCDAVIVAGKDGGQMRLPSVVTVTDGKIGDEMRLFDTVIVAGRGFES